MFTPRFAAGLLAAALFCAGCSSRTVSNTSVEVPNARIDAATAGIIRGVVRFNGPAPVMPVIDFSSNPRCERAHAKPVHEQAVVVNSNRTLRDTFVWLKSGLPAMQWTPPATAVKLDQDGCLYTPHVLALMVGGELEVTNSDPINHDVHIEASINPSSNEAEPPRAETLHKRFAAQEIWFPVTCSLHPWMRSYLSVVSHPFFAVTGTDGSFELKGVPPGNYTVEAIQEKFGRKELKVSLSGKEVKTADFVYGS